MNLNDIFKKNVPCDNIKSHQKRGYTLSLETTILEKPQGGGGGFKLTPTPSLFRVKSSALKRSVPFYMTNAETERFFLCSTLTVISHKTSKILFGKLEYSSLV